MRTPNARLVLASTMKSTWKIAPGDNANDWDLFRNNRCIGIGWLPDTDYRGFSTVTDALVALEKAHGPNAKGNGKGAAEMIREFTGGIKIGDIVVANNAYNEIVGIGMIESDYIPPTGKRNPLASDSKTHRHHVRLVDWVITRTAYIPGKPPKQYFFVPQTLKRLSPADVDGIVDAYVNAYPMDKGFAKKLKATFALPSLPTPRDAIHDNDIDMLISVKGEGRKRLASHIVRERDAKLVAAKKKSAKSLACEVCGFDSESFYGVRYCEAHHLTPLSNLVEGTKTTLNDLAIVCANCHRIIHSQYPPIEISTLRESLLEIRKNARKSHMSDG